MALISATDLQIKSMIDGAETSWSDTTSGYYDVGSYKDAFREYNYVICLKFTIASKADVIKFSYATVNEAYLRSLNWAIVSAESPTYANATASTSGDGLIGMPMEDGQVVSVGTYTHKLFKTLSAGTYYLYLWTDHTEVTKIQLRTPFAIQYGLYSDVVGEVDFKNFHGGDTYNHWKISGNIDTQAGWELNSYNWVTVFRFVTTTRAKSVTLSCLVRERSGASLKYKLVSGSEDQSLSNADMHTAADGVFDIGYVYEDQRLNLTVKKSIDAGVHYLYLWTNKSQQANNLITFKYITVNDSSLHTRITYEEANAVIYIDNGSGFDAYEIYIDNGSSWDLYQAYIDNGSSWNECG